MLPNEFNNISANIFVAKTMFPSSLTYFKREAGRLPSSNVQAMF